MWGSFSLLAFSGDFGGGSRRGPARAEKSIFAAERV